MSLLKPESCDHLVTLQVLVFISIDEWNNTLHLSFCFPSKKHNNTSGTAVWRRLGIHIAYMYLVANVTAYACAKCGLTVGIRMYL